jgi:acetyltransferase-like isoleucine patch superfamily enzyme
MTRRVIRHKNLGDKNQMRRWQQVISLWRSSWNFIVIYTAKYVPFAGLKNSMYRMLGMKVGPDAAIGLGAVFDVFFPELITVGDNSVIGYNCTILAHEFLPGEWRTGEVHIGENVLIGANTTVLAGVTIGDGATIGAGAVVTGDVPAKEFWVGSPARSIRKVLRGE